MTNIQQMIDGMYKGNTKLIEECVSSDSHILVLNSILAGTKIELMSKEFINGIQVATENEGILLGVPLKSVAKAALHLLGQRSYDGDDRLILMMIENGFGEFP